MAIPLSVLDLALVAEGATSGDALQRSVQIARRADTAGFSRFWVAEHHNMASVAATSPPVLVAAIAAQTERIRVGSGGVMLPNHSPLVVAEQFAALEALFPHRIDLGIGRAPGTDQRTARALRRDLGQLGVHEFPQNVLEIMAWLGDDRLPEDSSVSGLKATPNAQSYPEIWLLGSSGYAAQLAGMLGLRYCYAHHFGNMDPVQVMDSYRREFRPSPVLEEPYGMICTSAITADTEEEADYLAGPARLMALALRANAPGPIVSPETAARRRLSDTERTMLGQLPATKFVGTPDAVTAQLRGLTQRCGVQELMLTATTYAAETKSATLDSIIERWT